MVNFGWQALAFLSSASSHGHYKLRNCSSMPSYFRMCLKKIWMTSFSLRQNSPHIHELSSDWLLVYGCNWENARTKESLKKEVSIWCSKNILSINFGLKYGGSYAPKFHHHIHYWLVTVVHNILLILLNYTLDRISA